MGGFAAGRDSFEIFGGGHQRARIVEDAGGRHVVEGDKHPGSYVVAPFEAIYARGIDVPVWLGALPVQASIDAMVSRNALNGWFRAAREESVFAWDRGYVGAWQFPSNELSMTRLHVTLNETVHVLHPELAPLLPAVEPDGFIRQLP